MSNILGFVGTLVSLVGALVSLVGWFVYESLPMLIIGTVLWFIETIIEWQNLNAGAKIIDLVIFIVGSVVALYLKEPFYIGGLVAINIYSAIISVLTIPMIIANMIIAKLSSSSTLRKFENKRAKKANHSVPDFLYSDDEIRTYTQRYNNAFLILKDFNNGVFRNKVSIKSNSMLVDYIFRCVPLCLGWCVFHGNKDKKAKAIAEASRFLDDLTESAPEEAAEDAAKLKAMRPFYNSLYTMMVRYKKEQIDPAYMQDKSKENYERLLADFLRYICEIYPLIKWYDGIIEDFKHCMDDE